MGGKLWRKLGAWKAYMLGEKEERRDNISLGDKMENFKCLQMRIKPP